MPLSKFIFFSQNQSKEIFFQNIPAPPPTPRISNGPCLSRPEGIVNVFCCVFVLLRLCHVCRLQVFVTWLRQISILLSYNKFANILSTSCISGLLTLIGCIISATEHSTSEFGWSFYLCIRVFQVCWPWLAVSSVPLNTPRQSLDGHFIFVSPLDATLLLR